MRLPAVLRRREPIVPEIDEPIRSPQVAVVGCRQLRQLQEGVRMLAKARGVWEYQDFQLANQEEDGRYDAEKQLARRLDFDEMLRQLGHIAARPCEHYWTEKTIAEGSRRRMIVERVCVYCGAIEVGR